MFTVQVLGPSRRRSGHSIDVTVVVELASRIQDLSQNEPCKLPTHGVNPINTVSFFPNLTHLSFLGKKMNMLIHRISIIRKMNL